MKTVESKYSALQENINKIAKYEYTKETVIEKRE